MSVEISLSRLRAKVEAWPLKSVSAFYSGLLLLERGGAKLNMLEELRPWSGGRSDEIMWQLAEAAWFSDERSLVRKVSLARYVHLVAKRYLADAGNCLALFGGDVEQGLHGASETARAYRWLTLQLPPDLLVAGFCSGGAPPVSEVVALTSPGVRGLLARPVAQTHLHIGAALPFAELWTSMMIEIALAPLAKANKSLSRVGAFFGTEPALRLRLAQAALTRLALSAYLQTDMSGETFARSVTNWLARHAGMYRWPLGLGVARTLVLRALGLQSDVQGLAAIKTDLARSRALYAVLAASSLKGGLKIEQRSDLLHADPIWLGRSIAQQALDVRGLSTRAEPCPETLFAHSALCSLSNGASIDPNFARAFWRYQRIRCAVYSLVVEEPGTSGMDWFVRHYRGMSALRGPAESIVVSTGFDADSRATGLASFEVRTSPADTSKQNRDQLLAYARQMQAATKASKRRSEFGVVLHFIKSKSDRESDLYFGRYARWYGTQRRQAVAINAALHRDPRLLVLLRGIDACTLELAIPNWPFVSLFEKVREGAQAAARRLSRTHPDWAVPNIRATIHVGEEYRCLSDGLRRMHEVLEFGILKRGDRVGHGLALGEDPERWSRNAQRVAQPREERLDDLLWELDRYANGDFNANASRVEFVRDQASKLGCKIYGTIFPLEVLRSARRSRHNGRVVCGELGYPFTRHPRGVAREAFENESREVLFRYLTDKHVFRRGREPIEVSADRGQLELLNVAQEWLRGVYSAFEITIESNPSSNLIVGDYASLEHHPVFRMSPLPKAGEVAGSCLRVSVNTDDPTIVATSLADEYAHQYYTLLGMGVGSKDALSWLDTARQAGWDSRFTLPISAKRNVLRELVRDRARRRLSFP